MNKEVKLEWVRLGLRDAAVLHVEFRDAPDEQEIAWAALDQGPELGARPAAVAAILGREQWIVRDGDLSRVDVAFFTLNSQVGLIFFAGHLAERLFMVQST